jgi:hypothetical protein
MPGLLSKDEDLYKSAPAIGASILRMLSQSPDSRVSIFDIAKQLRHRTGGSVRSIYYAMLFLYALGIVDFNEPYVVDAAR